jgi:hypothetical protein
MTTRQHAYRTAAHSGTSRDFDAVLDPIELSDLEDEWLDKLRIDHARRAALDIYDYVELLGF